MLIIKPKYKKRGGSILKTLVTHPLAKELVLGAVSGAATTYGKRKLNNIINSIKVRRLVNGKGIVCE